MFYRIVWRPSDRNLHILQHFPGAGISRFWFFARKVAPEGSFHGASGYLGCRNSWVSF